MNKNNCITCQKEYFYPNTRKNSKYCSNVCRFKLTVVSICEFCNKEFDNNGHKDQKTCSKICEGKHKALKNFEELKNTKFGRLTIIELDLEKNNSHGYFYKTICRCGEIKSYRKDQIQKSGNNGCIKCGTYKHGFSRKGLSHTPTFTIWKGMMQRCYSETSFNYYLYGARGIKVCERWHNFENFLEDMGTRPESPTNKRSSNYHIDRINPDGDYEPENCRWITASENQKNRRNIHKNGYVFIKKDLLCEDCKSKTYNINLKD